MSAFRRIVVACLLLALLGGIFGTGYAQSSDSEFFPQTKHWVSGDFLATYHATENSLLLFGYPITREFKDPISGLMVQYFQKARLNRVEAENGSVVEIAPLGELMYDPRETTPVPVQLDNSACRKFESTGKLVCYAFQQFYDKYDGATYLGDPISNLEMRENRYVQYFQKARLEWHPELPAGQRVTVTDLGRIYFDQAVAIPEVARPETPSSDIIAQPIKLQASAYVSQILITSGSLQTVYAHVTDEYNNPIEKASLVATIYLPNGKKEVIRMPETDSKGISKIPFVVGQLPPRAMIQVEVTASAQGQQAQAQTWFRIWW